MKTSETIGFYVPAGTYVLSDPCYAVPDDDWMPLLESCDFFELPIGTVREHKVYAFSTMYGDGSYHGSDGFLYGVDAGLIGLTPIELVGEKEMGELFNEKFPLGTKVTFTERTHCYRTPEGLLKFGDIYIATGDNDEDEYDYDDE
jgi:hypothetical protein